MRRMAQAGIDPDVPGYVWCKEANGDPPRRNNPLTWAFTVISGLV